MSRHSWMSEDNLQKSVLSFRVGPYGTELQLSGFLPELSPIPHVSFSTIVGFGAILGI